MAEFPTLEDIFEPIEGKTGIEANEQVRQWYTGTRQLPGAAPSEAVTIADDVITPTSADVIVDTEGQAPADDLQIIKTESTHDGMILTLRAANPDRVVTVVATGQLNGITLWNRAERYVLSTTEQLVLQRDGNVWRETRGIGLALATDSELTLENTEMAVRASQLAASQQVLHIQDRKGPNIHGGTFTAGVWHQRDLNTIITNSIPGASLANNTIILPPGKYEIDAFATGFKIIGHQIRLVSAIDTYLTYLYGSAAAVPLDIISVSQSVIKGLATYNSSASLQLQHLAESTYANAGLGRAVPAATYNIYAEVFIRRIA